MPHDLKRSCPLCGSTSSAYLFVRHGRTVIRCQDCGLTGLDDPSVLPSVGADFPAAAAASSLATTTERHAAEAYLAALRRRSPAPSRIMVVAGEGHAFAAAAESQGITTAAQHDIRDVEQGRIAGGPYECAVVLFQLERAADPVAALEQIHRALDPGGVLLVVAPSLDSWQARFLGSQWTEWRPDARWYFDTQTIQSACLRSGFAEVEFAPDRRRYTAEHLHGRATTAVPTLLTELVGRIAPLVPGAWHRQLGVRLPGSGVIVTARAKARPARPVLSVVMPVFNERSTFEQTLGAVMAKDCPGVDKEIIIVESRSTDGTRELVEKYQGRPGITTVFEDRPRGKGAAVRTGLARATGALVLIQDADSEYDVNDYDALIEPVITFRRAFVLGSRHVGSWKMRRFTDQPGVSAFFNLGHIIFRTALNVIYRQRIKDPFTMYKVFRRDCLFGLRLECNRFDFDFELVIKLLRKGYVPLEIPVNYVSRSFKEGKKVSAWRDPLTWIRALVKYRFASIYEDGR